NRNPKKALEMGVTAAAALVGVGTIAVGVARVGRVLKAARAYHNGVAGAANTIRASRPVAAIAGRVHVRAVRLSGKYSETLKNGNSFIARGSGVARRSYRPAHRTPQYGWRSNLDVGVKGLNVKGKPAYRTFHVTHRSRFF
ncbi:hypothetical protein, partial [Cellulomonas sp.]|uniref:hypothetical protein n=1 Tax=Cellulomonas sp. TaxID=40001 RepID=UPI001B010881